MVSIIINRNFKAPGTKGNALCGEMIPKNTASKELKQELVRGGLSKAGGVPECSGIAVLENDEFHVKATFHKARALYTVWVSSKAMPNGQALLPVSGRCAKPVEGVVCERCRLVSYCSVRSMAGVQDVKLYDLCFAASELYDPGTAEALQPRRSRGRHCLVVIGCYDRRVSVAAGWDVLKRCGFLEHSATTTIACRLFSVLHRAPLVASFKGGLSMLWTDFNDNVWSLLHNQEQPEDVKEDLPRKEIFHQMAVLQQSMVDQPFVGIGQASFAQFGPNAAGGADGPVENTMESLFSQHGRSFTFILDSFSFVTKEDVSCLSPSNSSARMLDCLLIS
ncbi:hypothetical protein SELMODRAFT_428225 [Selaginella moellendorffii]|uniref:Uncharacterized protein n=1 Tax=Selaginella moellendorffii TaxID=88036 RepID=D8T253_SELML|nr:hypothetical protein SELMODRAFT_428225 [Selaginella moellendorffii]